MATAKRIAEKIIEEAGVPASTIKSITRRLTEDSLIERGSRGHPILNISARDCANLLLGVLALSDSYGTVSNRIGFRVREFESLCFPYSYEVMPGDDINAAIEIAPSGTFTDAFTGLLVKAADEDVASLLSTLIRRVGVAFQGEGVGAWIEFAHGVEFIGPPSAEGKDCEVRLEFGHASPRLTISRGERTSLERDASFTWQAIHRIAIFGAMDNPNWGA